MDPWLEDPALWPDVHHGLIAAARGQLQRQLGPEYYVAVEEREVPDTSYRPDVAVIERRPTKPEAKNLVVDQPLVLLEANEVEVCEPFLEIRSARGHRVLTVIEVLSPSNKRSGAGREVYVRKQREVLASDANLVEIDLLRGGEHTVAVSATRLSWTPYKVVVSRASDRKRVEIYLARLADRLPRIGVPFLEGQDIVLDLGAALAHAYLEGAYERRVDYARDPVPPLGGDDLAWARGIAPR